ncbi:3-oxoacyl-[acyl-carrier-protein] reductase FabG [compost metagenome]
MLINNAGVLDDALIGMVQQQQIERTFSTNSYSALYCSQYAARLISRSGGGSIINMASIIGKVGNAGQAVYAGSKAAVIGITQSLAKELAVSQIRVNAIAPGFIDTDMARSLPQAKFDERVASIAMGRIGTPDEVASVALFLASDLSRYVTGQVIGVDGGMLI